MTASRARASAISREVLESKLSAALDVLEGIIAAEDNPAKLAHTVGRYADTIVRAIATLYPPKQQLELSKAETDWDSLSTEAKLALIAQRREQLAVIEHETRLLLPPRQGTKDQ